RKLAQAIRDKEEELESDMMMYSQRYEKVILNPLFCFEGFDGGLARVLGDKAAKRKSARITSLLTPEPPRRSSLRSPEEKEQKQHDFRKFMADFKRKTGATEILSEEKSGKQNKRKSFFNTLFK